MAKNLSVADYDIRYWDEPSQTMLATLKAVSITRECPNLHKKKRAACVLVFAKAPQRGRLVQIRNGMEDYNFFVDETETANKAELFVFIANRLGLTKHALYSLIMRHAPALT